MRRLTKTLFGLLVVAAAGCTDQLLVENNNAPDRDRALARPGDVENLVAGQFRIIHNAMWTTAGIQPQLANFGLESYSANANFGMGIRSAVPRALIDNGRGNPGPYYNTFASLSQAARAGALTLNRFNDPSFTFFPTNLAQLGRDRAHSFFIMGVALGYTAMMFDSGPIIDPNDDLEAPNPFVAYDVLMQRALDNLDSAIALAASPANSAAGGFPIPSGWLGQAANVSAAQYIQLANSFKARFRAGVARTPTERAAVNWTAVIAEAGAAVAADMSVIMVNATGGWFYNPMQASTYQSWHQMWAPIVGMADTTTGGYDTWLGQARAVKARQLVQTNDTRFPAGVNRDAQTIASGCTLTSTNCTTPAGNYFRNRPTGQDITVDGLYNSFYDYQRFQAYFTAAQNGTLPFFPVAEMTMLRAEGYIRASDWTNAMIAINSSRTVRGLPALAGITSINDLLPGPQCVPRVPVGPTNAANGTPTASACGNIMEAMKWEKRMETAFLSPGGWYFDGRGWGDLPINTAVHFPVPNEELDARRQLIYSVPANGAGSGTYTAAERFSNSTSGYGLGGP